MLLARSCSTILDVESLGRFQSCNFYYSILERIAIYPIYIGDISYSYRALQVFNRNAKCTRDIRVTEINMISVGYFFL